MSTINCAGTLINLSKAHTMGIVNVTPDSFYDGGKLKSDKDVLTQVERMLDEGATFIDIGGYSSRPDGTDISEQEEIRRVIPVIELVAKSFNIKGLSCDSFRGSVIKKALQHGASLVNDISAGLIDQSILPVVAEAQVPYVMMHMRGTPQTMKTLTEYDDLIHEINYYFSDRIAAARALGINDIVIDAGFGFAKTREQNFTLLKNMSLLQAHQVPILAGVSRKSMIYKTLDTTSDKALNGTTALHMICLQQGAKILRVHDVAPAMECIKLFEELQEN
ncbi:dihydropteroate synthase [Nonlabens sp. SY33080]|uniref:dihydropteroate synthase n=1 Tax=Nonlabens sp. SY33080 TaxID=2719911 RepID=UPI001428D38F|nr:dihydropteroate synthase [Nonlabens sp. SY33080]